MGILQAWKQSFSLLLPANFMQFLREWIQTSKQVYAVVFTHWVPIAVIVSILFISHYSYEALFKPYMRDVINDDTGAYVGGASSISTHIFLIGLGLFLLNQLYNCVICAVGRSSEEVKDTTYFKKYLWHFCVLLLVMIGIRETYNYLFALVQFDIQSLASILILFSINVFAQPFYLIYVQCFFDTDGSLWHLVALMAFSMQNYETHGISRTIISSSTVYDWIDDNSNRISWSACAHYDARNFYMVWTLSLIGLYSTCCEYLDYCLQQA